MDEAHVSSKEWNSGNDQLILRWMIYLVVLADAAESVRDAIGFESPILWAEIKESSLIGPELVLETTYKVVSPWKGVVRFGKKGKLALRYVGLFEILERIGLVAYRIPLVKVRWNSKRGPEFTWELEDYMKSKYPHLFVDRAVEPTSYISRRDFHKEGIL
ncbi:hypothetical protein Tco_0863076 [Tanacetum coccineum]